jgi:arsenite-transporting ATPase
MPAAEEVALFDRIGSLIRGEDARFDLLVFDTAPTGHTLRLIRMPELMEAWIRALSRSRRAMLGVDQDDRHDPIMRSLADRLERLREFRARLVSPRITAFVLVLIAERLPIEETARALAQLEEAGVRVGALVVNRVLPETSPDPFLVARQTQERVYLDEIDRRFAAVPRLRVPQLARDVHGIQTLQTIAGALFPQAAGKGPS